LSTFKDEYVEVTPKSIRLRKYLTETDRKDLKSNFIYIKKAIQKRLAFLFAFILWYMVLFFFRSKRISFKLK
jgi:hypothetical protein